MMAYWSSKKKNASPGELGCMNAARDFRAISVYPEAAIYTWTRLFPRKVVWLAFIHGDEQVIWTALKCRGEDTLPDLYRTYRYSLEPCVVLVLTI
ncbi:unnamed protein product [Somion occarium]|uniref:Uncharacterized protein n=1 Tax=Somion occarium TaxID=3059160 RepID=A0ABP1CT61_9APHY